MTDREYDVMRKRHCETLVREHFHLHLPVDELLFDDIETGPQSFAVLFRSGRQLYALFVDEAGQQTLGDVKTMAEHIGLSPSKILPPRADPLYFKRQAHQHAAMVFPAIKKLDPATERFYQVHAPYAPGLMRVTAVHGPINRYVPSTGRWQFAFDFSFKKIPVF